MKRSEIYTVCAFSVLLFFVGVLYFGEHLGALRRCSNWAPLHDEFVHEEEAVEAPNASVFENPSATDLTKLDEHSTSTAHVLAREWVSPGMPSATSSPRSIRVPVMIYHSVRPHYPHESVEQDTYDITPELLDEELSYLAAHGYTTIRFADISAALDQNKPLPAKPIILSFDDGWENQYRYAFPVLVKHHAVGTFYVYTGPVGRMPHWMTWSQIAEMDKAGMEIGGHSRTHPFLTKILDNAALDREIKVPKKVIEQHLGHPITTFAYPFGYYNARVVAAVRRAGYATARDVFKGVWIDPTHRFEIRGALSTDDIADFIKYVKMP